MVRKKTLADSDFYIHLKTCLCAPQSPLHRRHQETSRNEMKAFSAAHPPRHSLPLGTALQFGSLPGDFSGSCLVSSDSDRVPQAGPGRPFSLRGAVWNQAGCSLRLSWFSSRWAAFFLRGTRASKMTGAGRGNTRGPRGGVYGPSQGRGRGILTGMGGQSRQPARVPAPARCPGLAPSRRGWAGAGPAGVR